jgi:hypothetical protein
MGILCTYEQELKKEYNYSNKEYDLIRAKEHEKKRHVQNKILFELTKLKKRFITSYQSIIADKNETR